MKNIFLILVTISYLCSAQTVYEIPLNTGGNLIELNIKNDTNTELKDVKIEVESHPEWIKFESKILEIETLGIKQNYLAKFEFTSYSFLAEIDTQTVRVGIWSENGSYREKIILIAPEKPNSYELSQNYPNPFNPSTTISFALPERSKITLRVFNILGQQVDLLFEGEKEAGYHRVKWNALNLATGIYIYQLEITDTKNKNHFFRKKMLMLK